MGKQMGFYFNQHYCVGCQACETACKNKNKLDVGIRWRVVDHVEDTVNGRQVDRYLTYACMHCEKPACAAACPVKAYSKRAEDGIVILNREKCVGCRACINACPYKAISFNRNELKATKCDLCLDYLQQGQAPACVRGCPLKVLKAGDMSTIDKAGASKNCPSFPQTERGPSIRFAPERVG